MLTLEDLPRELLHQIVESLDLATFSCLKRTSLGLSKWLQLSDLPQAQRVQFMQRADRLPQNADLLACYRCCEMLPKTRFGLGQRRGNRRKTGAKPTVDRFCLECAAKNRLYGHMETIVLKKGEDSRLMLCHECGRYGTRYRHCGPAEVGVEGGVLHADGDREWKCWSDDAEGSAVPSLEALPAELLGQIVSLLSYPDAISLASACARLRKDVDRSDVPVQSRFDFVAKRDVESSRRRRGLFKEETSVCYACFRVRPVDMFTNEQMYLVETQKKIPYWQRRCRNCLYRMHANKDGEEVLKEWRKQKLCKGCDMLKHEDFGCLSDACPENQRTRDERKIKSIGHLPEVTLTCTQMASRGNPTSSPSAAIVLRRLGNDPLRVPGALSSRAVLEIQRLQDTYILDRRLPQHEPMLRKVKAGPGPLFGIGDDEARHIPQYRGFPEAGVSPA